MDNIYKRKAVIYILSAIISNVVLYFILLALYTFYNRSASYNILNPFNYFLIGNSIIQIIIGLYLIQKNKINNVLIIIIGYISILVSIIQTIALTMYIVIVFSNSLCDHSLSGGIDYLPLVLAIFIFITASAGLDAIEFKNKRTKIILIYSYIIYITIISVLTFWDFDPHAVNKLAYPLILRARIVPIDDVFSRGGEINYFSYCIYVIMGLVCTYYLNKRFIKKQQSNIHERIEMIKDYIYRRKAVIYILSAIISNVVIYFILLALHALYNRSSDFNILDIRFVVNFIIYIIQIVIGFYLMQKIKINRIFIIIMGCISILGSIIQTIALTMYTVLAFFSSLFENRLSNRINYIPLVCSIFIFITASAGLDAIVYKNKRTKIILIYSYFIYITIISVLTFFPFNLEIINKIVYPLNLRARIVPIDDVFSSGGEINYLSYFIYVVMGLVCTYVISFLNNRFIKKGYKKA